MQHAVGQHEVDQGIHVHPEVEVLPVIPGEPRRDAVVVEQHGGHTVKAEAIKAVLLNEPAEVGQQQPQHLPLAVVKHLGVPQLLLPACPCMEEAVVRAVEVVEAIVDVASGVAVDHIQ